MSVIRGLADDPFPPQTATRTAPASAVTPSPAPPTTRTTTTPAVTPTKPAPTPTMRPTTFAPQMPTDVGRAFSDLMASFVTPTSGATSGMPTQTRTVPGGPDPSSPYYGNTGIAGNRPLPTPTGPGVQVGGGGGASGSVVGGIPPFSMDAFLNIVRQINPQTWETDYLRFKPYFDAWGVEPQRGSDGNGAFRGRFKLPGMAGYDWDPWANGLGWGLASYDPRVTGAATGDPTAQTTGAPSGTGGGSVFTDPNNVFTDPATTQWEQLLRALVDAMHVEQPTWTPGQLELQQTQVLDPLQRQADAEIQQAIQWGAQHGQDPNSGPVLQRIDDIKRRYSQQRTQAQSQVANTAIQREDALFRNNEQRRINAVNLMKQIPQLADSRLQLAMQTLIPSNPANLLSLQQQYSQQNQNYNQQQYQNGLQQQQMDAQFWAQMAQLIADAMNN